MFLIVSPSDAGAPLACLLVEKDPKDAGRVIYGNPYVAPVLRPRNFPQIIDAIVEAVSVDVVDFAGPIALGDSPHDVMGTVMNALNIDNPVPCAGHTAGRLAAVLSVPLGRFVGAVIPEYFARIYVNLDPGQQFFERHGLGHSDASLNRRDRNAEGWDAPVAGRCCFQRFGE